jgi:tryptophan-rich sensory protein
VIGVAPAFTTPVFALTAVWMLLAMVVAVRQALDYTTTTRALAVCGLGWALTLAFVLTLGLVVI